MKVPQITGMSCTLACFEAFSAQNDGIWTQRAIMLAFPDLCQGKEKVPGYVLTEDYVKLASLIGIYCKPIPSLPLPAPHYPRQSILIGAGDYHGGEHSLLWIRPLPQERGLAMDPNPEVRNYVRFKLDQLKQWKSFCWLLRI